MTKKPKKPTKKWYATRYTEDAPEPLSYLQGQIWAAGYNAAVRGWELHIEETLALEQANTAAAKEAVKEYFRNLRENSSS